MKIAIAGGHLTPALALIEELKKYSVSLIYLGRTRSLEGDKTPSAESIVIPQFGVKFFGFNPGRLQRKFSTQTIFSLARVFLGFVQAFFILFKEKPKVIVSFGSYVALPVVIAGWLLKIPIITHEQTASLGLANKIITLFARKIGVSWQTFGTSLPKEKVIFVGNFLRKEILAVKKRNQKVPLIYITGGNQGSHLINETVSHTLEDLLKDFYIVHQTGSSQIFGDFEMLTEKRQNLPSKLANRYRISKWFNTKELAKIYSKASFVVSRAGANTLYELSYLGIPAIFIPISWSANNEQTKNAKMLEKLGCALILLESSLSPKRFLNAVFFMNDNLDTFRKKTKKAKEMIKTNGLLIFVDEIFKLVNA